MSSTCLDLVKCGVAGGAGNTRRPLTHTRSRREGLAMQATRICAVEDCEQPVRARGWCGTHYMRNHRHGDPHTDNTRARSRCLIYGCGRLHEARGLCNLHYGRLWKYGSTVDPNPSLRQRFWAEVRKTDTCWIWTGVLNDQGYGQLSIRNRAVYAHRISYEMHVGTIPDGWHVDHRCHTRSCVRPDHLRATTPGQNAQNHQGARRNSKSGVRGVHPSQNGEGWIAQVTIPQSGKGARQRLTRSFHTIEEAEQWAVETRNSLHTHNDWDRRGDEEAP